MRTTDSARRGSWWTDDFVQDLRFAVRTLARNRAFAVLAIATLALGISANAAIFSIIEAVLLKPLPFRDPDRLVWITEYSVTTSNNLATIFGDNVQAWRTSAQSLDALSVLFTGDATMSGAEPVSIRFASVSESLEGLFGVAPALGRDFRREELEHGPSAPGLRASGQAATAAVAILSDGLYRRRFAGERAVLGTALVIGNTPYTVIGVLPPTFRLPVTPSLQLGIGSRADVEIILNTTVGPTYRGPGALVGRLKRGVPIETAAAELEAIRSAAKESNAEDRRTSPLRLQVSSLHDQVVGSTRRPLLIIWAIVGFVLVVACVNVINLLLARSVSRAPELAIRTALGASRWRLARQMLAESAVLAAAGGTAGVAMAYAAVRALARTSVTDVPRLQDARLDLWAFTFTFIVCVFCAALVGVLPALRSSTASRHALEETGRASWTSARTRHWHAGLIVCELALAFIPLAGASLMLKSLLQVQSEGASLSPHQVLTARIQSATPQVAGTPAERLRHTDQMLARIESLPGVRTAAIWSVTFGYPVRIADVAQDEEVMAMWFDVTPRFREASGVRLLAGRWFGDEDRTATRPVVVVSERLARKFGTRSIWDASIVGRTTFGPFAPAGAASRDTPMTIIGVVGDFRSGRLGIMQPDDPNPLPQVFFSDGLSSMAAGELLVRTSSDPLALVRSIAMLVESSPGARLVGARTLEDQMSSAVATRGFKTILMTTFGGMALLLAVVGVTAVLWYSVTQRMAEIAIRVALGAQRADILRMVLGRAATLVVTGLAIGLLGSTFLSRVIAGLLYGVSPTDAVAYVAVCLVLGVIALVAAFLPARKAMSVDPIMALRHQ
jgi:putative ABC transport system permease protein